MRREWNEKARPASCDRERGESRLLAGVEDDVEHLRLWHGEDRGFREPAREHRELLLLRNSITRKVWDQATRKKPSQLSLCQLDLIGRHPVS